MGSLLDSLSVLGTPELAETAARMIGVDIPTAMQAAQLTPPLLIAALARQTEQPGGRDTVSALLEQIGPGIAADPNAAIGNLVTGKYGDVLGDVMGSVESPLLNDLTRAADISGLRSLLKFAAPLGVSAIAAEAEKQALDKDALAALLQTEAREIEASDDPNARIVNAAFTDIAAQDAVKKQFTADQWNAVSSFPALAAGYVAAAGHSGPFGSIKEFAALSRAFDPSRLTGGSALLDAIWNNREASVNKAAETGDLGAIGLDHFNPDDAEMVQKKVLDVAAKAREALAVVSPEEAAAYRNEVMKAATTVAESSKEGGFLGIGGKVISDKERVALNRIRVALGA
jgi:hypothetical protein